MTEELKQAAQEALEVLKSATSFMSKKARDQHPKTVARLERALTASQPAQAGEVDERAVDKAWGRFAIAMGDSPGSPYPGMAKAFEAHFGQSWLDKDWRNEQSVWAAAWRKAWDGTSLPTQPAAQATPETLTLGPLAKRNIYDAIRGAYDLGYNDARNARTVPGDSAPGYDGRSVEEDHGGALFNLLSRRLKTATFTHPAPGVPEGFALVPVEPTPEMIRCAEMWDDGFEGAYARALAAAQAKGADHA